MGTLPAVEQKHCAGVGFTSVAVDTEDPAWPGRKYGTRGFRV